MSGLLFEPHLETQDALEKADFDYSGSQKPPFRSTSLLSAPVHFTNSLNIVDRKQRLSLELDLRSETRLGNRSVMRSPLLSPFGAGEQYLSPIRSLDTPASDQVDDTSNNRPESPARVRSPPLAVVKK